jgi:uncharacterized protein YbbC (DUF1343 family)
VAYVLSLVLMLAVDLPEASPAELGFDANFVKRIDDSVDRAIAAKKVPGAVVIVGRSGKIAHVAVRGMRSVSPNPEPMTRDTIFDLASLTKPVATASAVMLLVEREKLKLDDTVAKLLPDFAGGGKGAITVEQLLRHRSGLIADNPISDYEDGPIEAWKKLAALKLVSEPGAKFLYSDVNFILLGKIVEQVGGEPLDRFAAREVFGPLGMKSTFFPGGQKIDVQPERFAPTEPAGGSMLRGTVHDPRARALGGVAGHAGLFGTADDLAVFATMLLADGKSAEGRAILQPNTVNAMKSRGATAAPEARGLGWDIDTAFGAPRGCLFGKRSFGHTGFTGTSLWLDPDTKAFVIVLTSRLHPDGKAPSPTSLRYEIGTITAASIEDRSPPVLAGIDVLERDDFARLKGKRIGLITNQTGRTRDGRSTIDALFHAPGVKLVALFSPEHGLRGVVDKEVADTRNEATGLPVFSLYGENRRPTAKSLEGVDVLVYDIQDIGTRFYTYISTLGLCMEAAAEAKVGFMVLDRPNPIGGVVVGGPVRDAEFASFIAYHDLPVRHGMTVGELAKMFAAERKIAVDLTVVTCNGWHRDELFDRTGREWVNPSPNMRSLTEAMLYPGVGLLESTNLATGRGTDTPFEKVGAPWIEGVRWASILNGLELAGVRFVPIKFQPTERQFAGVSCGGVQVVITDWAKFDPIELALGMAVSLHAVYPTQWKPEGFRTMLADRSTYDAMLGGMGVAGLKGKFAGEVEAFRRRREAYLIYR